MFRWGPVFAALAAITICAPAWAQQPAPYAAPGQGRTVVAGWNNTAGDRYDDVIAIARNNNVDGSARGIVDEFSIECVADTVVVRELWTEKLALTATPTGDAQLTADTPAEGIEWDYPGCESDSDDHTYSELSGVPFKVAASWTSEGLARPLAYYEGSSWSDCMDGFGGAGLSRGAYASLDDFRGQTGDGWQQYAGEIDTTAFADAGNDSPACGDNVRADLRGANGRAAQQRAADAAVRGFRQGHRAQDNSQDSQRARPDWGAGADAGEIAVGEWFKEDDTSFQDVFAIGGVDAALAPSTGLIDVFYIGCKAGELVLSDYLTVDASYSGTPMTSAQLAATGGFDGVEVRWPDCDPESEADPVESDRTGVPINATVAFDQDGDTTPYSGQEADAYGICTDTDNFAGLYRPAKATLQLQASPDVDAKGLDLWDAQLAAGGGAGSYTYADTCGGDYSRADLRGENGRAAQLRAAKAMRRAFFARR